VKASTAAVVALIALFALGCDNGNPSGPSAGDMRGRWTGTSTYPNAPFQLTLNQDGENLRGQYSDGLDRSLNVTGTFTAPTFAIVVDFGDAKLNLNGTVLGARSAQGVMFTSALGNRQYPFTMTR
jgi:hypothetical protein